MNVCRKKQESGNKVRFVLDEFQYLYIPDLKDKVKAITENDCEIDIMIQSFNQINDALNIIDFCDNIICMGTMDHDAAKLVYILSDINVFTLSALKCIVIEKDNRTTQITSYSKEKEFIY